MLPRCRQGKLYLYIQDTCRDVKKGTESNFTAPDSNYCTRKLIRAQAATAKPQPKESGHNVTAMQII
jgi:hypothetical protein